MKRVLKYSLFAVAVLLVFVLVADSYISYAVRKQLYDNVQNIGHNRVGLVLGTSKYAARGRVNLYYKYRIEAAVALFKAGKIDFILVSGDNRKLNYNEPETMKKDLVAAGVPEGRIYMDYAGFRTLDSIVRSDAVFDAGSITIISQRFHNERALYIANNKNINAIAYNAQDPPQRLQAKVLMREKLARVKMLLDLLLNKQPRFYGDKIEIKDTAATSIYAGYPDLSRDDITVVNVSGTKRANSSDTRDYNEVCKDWTLDKTKVSKLLKYFKPIAGTEWDATYDVTLCRVDGKMMIDSVEYAYSINAGSYMSLSDGENSYLYGCDNDSCKPYFLTEPWHEEDDVE